MSSSKYINKFASNSLSRSLINERRSSKKSCLCLFVGITLGICLAGILHYSIVQSETYRFGAKRFKRIIPHDVLKNESIIPNVKTQSLVKELEVDPNSVLPIITTNIPEEVTKENITTESTQHSVKKSEAEEVTVPSSSTSAENTTEAVQEILQKNNETIVNKLEK